MRHVLATLTLLLAPAVAGAAGPDCAALVRLKLPQAQVLSATPVAAGEPLALWAGGQRQAMPKAFCRVRGLATPVPGSAIGFEVWLPAAAAWNGKFLQAGNGGTAGSIPLTSLMEAVQRGYAAAATDGGHVWPDGLDYGWAANRPQSVVDFAWRAVQRTADAAQRIVRQGLGRAPARSYFMACADGGKFISDPQQCRFDPGVLQCAGAETDDCLTERQVVALRRAYAGFVDPSGRRLPGLAMGAEAEPGNWDFWLLRAPTNPIGGAPAVPGAPLPTSINESFFRHLVRQDTAFTLAELRDEDIVQARQRWGSTLDATDPDLSRLKQRGSKLLQYHGWTDAPIPPRMSLDYFAAVQQRMGDTRDFHRLFMVPGMNHCGGGEGPWQVDWLGVLERWVEQGEAPLAITARHPKDGSTQTLRPHGLP
jgi:hypothetical protein